MDHEQAEAVGNAVEGTILICARNARTLFDLGSIDSFVTLHFACELQ